MEILNVRVDSRGIHGQVATQWVPQLGINRIIVIDDDSVKDATQKMVLKMARPETTKLSVLSTDKALERLKDEHSYEGEKSLIIFQKLETIATLEEKGYLFDVVTLGNIPQREGTKNIQKTINLTDEEVGILDRLREKGTKFIYQMVPSDSIVEIDHI